MKRTALILVLGTLFIGGCTSYYRVTDPTSGKVYYTTEVRKMDNGAAQLKDASTGNKITIQNSSVAKISKEQFEQGKNAAPAMAPEMK